MGCGQSKINIYPRKSKGKHASKKSGGSSSSGRSHNKDESNLEDEGNGSNLMTGEAENDGDNSESGADDAGSDAARLKLKSLGGGPLTAHTEISESQQNFFKMLDEKIESGKDYDSSSETEQIKENERLNSLLQDWESASSASRSLPTTPRHRIATHQQQQSSIMAKQQTPPQHHHHITQSIIHQSYGVTPKSSLHHTHTYHPSNSNNNGIYPPNIHDTSFQPHSSQTYSHLISSQAPIVNFPKAIPSNLQFQEITTALPTPNTTQIRQNLTNFVVQRQYQMAQQHRSEVSVLYNSLPVPGSSSPVHIAKQSSQFIPQTATCSPHVAMNSSPIHYKTQMVTPNVRNTPMTTFMNNGVELSIQQQMYNNSQQQMQQYQQSKEIEQYKYTREQLLLQQQQQQQILMSTNKPTGRVVGNHSSFQSSVPPQTQQQQQQQQQVPIRAIATMSPPTARHAMPTIDKVVYKKTRPSQPQQQQYSSHEMT